MKESHQNAWMSMRPRLIRLCGDVNAAVIGILSPFNYFSRLRNVYEGYSILDFTLLAGLMLLGLIYATRGKGSPQLIAWFSSLIIAIGSFIAYVSFPQNSYTDQLSPPVELGSVLFHPASFIFGLYGMASFISLSAWIRNEIATHPGEDPHPSIIRFTAALMLSVLILWLFTFIPENTNTIYLYTLVMVGLTGVGIVAGSTIIPWVEFAKTPKRVESIGKRLFYYLAAFGYWLIAGAGLVIIGFVFFEYPQEFHENIVFGAFCVTTFLGSALLIGIMAVPRIRSKLLISLFIILPVIGVGFYVGVFNGGYNTLFWWLPGIGFLFWIYLAMRVGFHTRGRSMAIFLLLWLFTAYISFIPTHSPFIIEI